MPELSIINLSQMFENSQNPLVFAIKNDSSEGEISDVRVKVLGSRA